MSRILIWSPNYAPELTGIPPLVTDAAEWLAANGHAVDVVTAMPNYPERRIRPGYRGLWSSELIGSVRVHRSWLRVRPRERFVDKALYELTFSTLSLPLAARLVRKADVVLCVIPTLGAAAYARALVGLSGGSTRLVLWVQDLVLSAALSLDSVGLRARRILYAAERVEGAVARAADRVIVCSPGFEGYYLERGVSADRLETIYNWVDVERIAPRPPASDRHATHFLYAGNIGYTQGFETLFDAARLVERPIEVEIVGGGNAADHVRALAATCSAKVRVRPPVALAEYAELLASADAHLVVQRHVSAGANLPSKIAPYLASGRPIVASIDSATPAAELLRRSGGALLVEPESPHRLAEAMTRLHDDKRLRASLARAGRKFAVTQLDRCAALSRLERVLVG